MLLHNKQEKEHTSEADKAQNLIRHPGIDAAAPSQADRAVRGRNPEEETPPPEISGMPVRKEDRESRRVSEAASRTA